MTTLAQMNELRKKLNMPPIGTWTKSAEELDDEYAQLVKMNPQPNGAKAPAKGGKFTGKVKAKADDKKSEKKEVEVASVKLDEIRKRKLGEICKSNKFDPRRSRIYLRDEYGKKGHKLPDTVGDAWAWLPGDPVRKIEAFLRAKFVEK